MVMLKFCQKMLACKLSHPLNLENEIFKKDYDPKPIINQMRAILESISLYLHTKLGSDG